MGILTPLTTPVAYINSIPLDVFAKFKPDFPGIIASDQIPPWTFFYYEDDPGIPGTDGGGSLKPGEYVLQSAGPNNIHEKRNTPLLTRIYDSTNGTRSYGDIIYSSFTQFEPSIK